MESVIPFLLALSLCIFCWIERGPAILRWGLAGAVVLLATGQPSALEAARQINELTGPLLVFLIMALGFTRLGKSQAQQTSAESVHDEMKG